MKKVLTLIALCCALFIQSCKYSTEWQTATAGENFALSLPPWLEKVDNLKPDAQLQYSSQYRNFYVIGETLNANKPAAAIVSENIDRLKLSMTKPVVTDSTSITVGGLTGSRVEVYGKMNDEAIYFTEVLLEGKGKLYHYSIWTRNEKRKLDYKNDINKIVTSFKVL
jgi:hypothetical protein